MAQLRTPLVLESLGEFPLADLSREKYVNLEAIFDDSIELVFKKTPLVLTEKEPPRNSKNFRHMGTHILMHGKKFAPVAFLMETFDGEFPVSKKAQPLVLERNFDD